MAFSPTHRSVAHAIFATACALFIAAALAASGASAQDPQTRLDRAQAGIAETEQEAGVLTSEIAELDDQIDTLGGEVAALQAQLAGVREELAAKQTELEQAIIRLRQAKRRLEVLRGRLKRSLITLRVRLIDIYKTGTTDVTGVLLSSDGYDELVTRSDYLSQIQDADDALTDRVRDLRDQTQREVEALHDSKETIEEARDAIAAQEAELESAEASLSAQQAELQGARAERGGMLASVRAEQHRYEEIAADVRAEIEAQVAEATEDSEVVPEEAPAPSPAPAPESSSGMIWPVEGVFTSPFGPRWGSIHEGIDISAPEGTPIMAAASGTVILTQSEAESGGYGLYTCIDHGGGLSTCYAHQSGFATSSGASVSQGQVIGYVGNTGHSFGAHLHFEVRADGVAQDPLGYL